MPNSLNPRVETTNVEIKPLYWQGSSTRFASSFFLKGELQISEDTSGESYKKNYTYEDWLREQAQEEAKKAREKSGAPNLAVSSMPAFASLEDVLRYFLYEESGIILDAGADKLEE